MRSERQPTLLMAQELVIRTTQLLLKVEESMDHEIAHSGNAVVLASWDAQ